jgi:hypothetical protein
MRILFQGLICHTSIVVGGQKQQIAVLPVAADHKATLNYRKADIYRASSTGNLCYDLAGCVDTGQRGEASVLQIGDLPKLTTTTTGTALSGGVMCPPDATTIRSIFFLPPGGRLFCDYYFADEVKFNGVHHGPVPQLVIYSFNPTGSFVTFNLGSKTVQLVPSAEIVVANVCKTTTGGHYQFYKNILNGSVMVYDPVKSGPCTFATPLPVLTQCEGGSTLDVDCVNSQFP